MRKFSRKQIGAVGLAVIMSAQGPVMAAEVAQEETAAVTELQTEETEPVLPQESVKESVEESAEESTETTSQESTEQSTQESVLETEDESDDESEGAVEESTEEITEE